MDGATLDVPGTADNDEYFGRPGGGRGESRGGFPQIRLVGVAECGTHALFAAAIGPYSTPERALATHVLPAVGPAMLLMADRGFTSHDLWQHAAATGADLLWRATRVFRLPVLQEQPDGSYLSQLIRKDHEPIRVRVIECTIDDGRAPEDEHYRLVTTLLDPEQAPALELAELYAQRWEFETALDELKTHQRGARVVLRSKSPDGVEQEVGSPARALGHPRADAHRGPGRRYRPRPSRQNPRTRHPRTVAAPQQAPPTQQPTFIRPSPGRRPSLS